MEQNDTHQLLFMGRWVSQKFNPSYGLIPEKSRLASRVKKVRATLISHYLDPAAAQDPARVRIRGCMSKQSAAFEREKARFDNSTDFAISVSKLYAGREANIPVRMASYVFTRTCVGADSLRHLVQRDLEKSNDTTLDHYSISVLARNIVEVR